MRPDPGATRTTQAPPSRSPPGPHNPSNTGDETARLQKPLDLKRPDGAHREKRYTAVEQELGHRERELQSFRAKARPLGPNKRFPEEILASASAPLLGLVSFTYGS
jgi:hypothetical protein